jgi:hypothetical protein
MEHAVLAAAPYLAVVGASGMWLRWAAVPALIAYGLGRRIERIRQNVG